MITLHVKKLKCISIYQFPIRHLILKSKLACAGILHASLSLCNPKHSSILLLHCFILPLFCLSLLMYALLAISHTSILSYVIPLQNSIIPFFTICFSILYLPTSPIPTLSTLIPSPHIKHSSLLLALSHCIN